MLLQTSSDGSQSMYLDDELPVALQPQNYSGPHDRRQSFLRRLSNATFGSEDDEDDPIASRALEDHHQDEEDKVVEMFTAKSQVERSFTRPGDEERLSLISEKNTDSETAGRPPPQRRASLASSIGLGFFDSSLHNARVKIAVGFLVNYIYLTFGLVIVLCIYWGAYYERTLRFKNVSIGVVNADVEVDGIPPILGPIVENFFRNFEEVQALGDFSIYNITDLEELAKEHNSTIHAEALRQLHHQKHWALYYVPPNTTYNLLQRLGLASSTPLTNEIMDVYYETGRDYSAVATYILSLVNNQISLFNQYAGRSSWLSSLTSLLNETERAAHLLRNPGLFTSVPTFRVVDLIPVPNLVAQAPLQVGLMYLVIWTFFQFLFMLEVHLLVGQKLKGIYYVFYRFCVSQSAYFVLSFAFVLVNRAFGLSWATTFGLSGFLVIWAFSFLVMSSLGSTIEVLVTIVVMLNPMFIGYIMVLISVTNLAVILSPIVLCPTFYRYGYAMPLYNAYHLMHIVYFDSYKGNMGRYIGVMLAWIFCANLTLPFMLKLLAKRMQR